MFKGLLDFVVKLPYRALGQDNYIGVIKADSTLLVANHRAVWLTYVRCVTVI